jgi:hypothetical protein
MELTFEQKKEIADKYIGSLAGGLGWDDLADINSLHDAETEEDVKELCDERLGEEGFPFDCLEE